MVSNTKLPTTPRYGLSRRGIVLPQSKLIFIEVLICR